MERLTKYNEERAVWLLDDYGDDDSDVLGEAIDKLADYENAEEQGLLLKLPCKVGDTVYWAYDCRMIREVIVYGFRVTPNKILMLDYSQFPFGNIGVDVFLTKEEAEKALADLGV